MLSANVVAVLPKATGAQLVDTDHDGITDVVEQQLGSNTSVADARNQLAPPSLSIPGNTTPAFVLSATVGQLFNYSLGSGSSYGISAGELPPGLNVSATGLVSGTPLVSGGYSFGYQASGADTIIGRIDVTASQLIWNMVGGWNQLGNSSYSTFNVADLFSNTTQVTSVWNWLPDSSNWAFYAPIFSAADLAAYNASHGYATLTTIYSGEGFWINSKTTFSAQIDATALIESSSFQPGGSNAAHAGWSMIATGDNKTPSDFNKAIGSTPPATGVIPINLTTLWVWDAVLANYYFYSPSLEQNGQLASYVASHGYLDFGTRTITPATCIWLNK